MIDPTKFDIQVYDAAEGISVVTYDIAGNRKMYDFRDEADNKAKAMKAMLRMIINAATAERVRFNIKAINDY